MHARPRNFVTEVAAAPVPDALAHFESKLCFETDCWDVHSTQGLEDRGFVLLDVRSAEAFAKGHLPGAINIPRQSLFADRLAQFDADALFVTYCAGPHCNASTKAAIRLARMGRRVKETVGGTVGWLDERFSLVTS